MAGDYYHNPTHYPICNCGFPQETTDQKLDYIIELLETMFKGDNEIVLNHLDDPPTTLKEIQERHHRGE